MALQPPASLTIDHTEFTLEEAYKYLKIKDANISDGDVVVAFWSCKSLHKDNALKTIYSHRQSQWLAFILTILPHLTDDNVALLATSSPLPTSVDLSSNVKNEDSNYLSNPNDINTSGPDAHHLVISDTAVIDTSDGKVLTTPIFSDDTTTSPEDHISASSEKTISSGIPLSEEDSVDSDFDEKVGGRYWNGKIWRCEECNDELVNGRCPNGDLINPCQNCARDFQSGECSDYCDECHNGLEEQCIACARDQNRSIQGSDENARMVWDDQDGLWRCTVCLWEVEANSEEEGQCHCQMDPEGINHNLGFLDDMGLSWATVRARCIELLYYHEYEPADSDSSGLESVDSEPDSDDEAFVEDDGPFDPAILTLEPPFLTPDEQKDTGEPMDTA